MKILVPTEIEASRLRPKGLSPEIIGMGPVEAALGAYQALLNQNKGPVILAGIGGAYPDSQLKTGDIALASVEFFGDLGICYDIGFQPFSEKLPVKKECSLRHPLLEKALAILEDNGFSPECGPFVTVCCATRDISRAELLAIKHQNALIENMEGFSVALVAQKLGFPLIEIRAVSNLLTEPDSPWAIDTALEKLGEALLCLNQKL
ncbi:phosphorylase family protein [Thermodesulfatator indicus]